LQCVERAGGGDHERAGDERRGLVVRELRERPGIQQVDGEIADAERAVGGDHVTDGVLHEGVGDQDEVAREPASHGHGDGGQKVVPGAEPPLPVDQYADEGAFE